MAKYSIEVIYNKGNFFREGADTLIETRIRACRLAKKYDGRCEIYENTGYGRMKNVEFIFYDDVSTAQYTDLRPGFYLQKRGGSRSRVSPKTGRLLDVSKTWRRI